VSCGGVRPPRRRGGRATTILAATEAARKAFGFEPDEDEEAIRRQALARLGTDCGLVE
jgi:hypothetical protein